MQVEQREFETVFEVANKLRATNRPAQVRRICWVTDEMLGLFKNGGGGTVVSGFCHALLSAGHTVTVLYTSGVDQSATETASAIARFRAQGLEMVFLEELPSTGGGGLIARSYAVHKWLKTREFDIVHFHDFNGSGFAACTAKRMGLAHATTLLCVSNFGSSRWAWECMEYFPQTPSELERDWIERRALENADVVLCQSRYMAEWLTRNRYVLPPATYVQPSIIPLAPGEDGPSGRSSTRIREVVFFGRQEVRKGIRVFVAAAELLAKKNPDLRFTFSGKFSEVDWEHSGSYALSRLAAIPNDITFLAHPSRDQALRHLKSVDVLAVMPSVDDNFPGTVIEAVSEGIEFVASNRGGIPEIVHSDNHAERLFEPTPQALAAAVQRVISARPPRPRLAFDPKANVEAWMEWHARVPIEGEVLGLETSSGPLVSVCVVHYDRPRFLAMVIEALSNQSYHNFEVILVDDGSIKSEALRYLNELESQDLPFVLKIVRTSDVRLGAARNAGARAASGEFLIFVDDDNVPRANMIECLVRAAQRRDLDVATCYAYILSGDGPPDESGPLFTGYYPAGGPISQGLTDNVYGDANALVRRSTFMKLEGFDPEPGVGAEDWDFFARAVLSGYKLEVVPEPLYWYRQHDAQLTMRWHSTHRYYERLLRTYCRMLDQQKDELQDALRIYLGKFSSEKLKGASWHNLGLRQYGELQRQLIPHVNNTEESYRLLSLLCLQMGRFRDAARLVAHGTNPHVHLLELGRSIDHLYSVGRDDFPQGYYGESPFGARSIPILGSVLSRVRRATPPSRHFPHESVSYDGGAKRIQVHPIKGAVSLAVIQDGFPANMRKLSAVVQVDHPAGPEVIFSILLISADLTVKLNGTRMPEGYLGKAEARVGPKGGPTRLTVLLEEPASEPLSIVLATESLGTTDYAWAKFGALSVAL